MRQLASLEGVAVKKEYTFDDLVHIMAVLRGENGCPWDREQTHETLMAPILEETYEVMDAIKKEDMKGICEELGDVLLQVVFHSQIAKENQVFTVDDVITGICKKLILRHPHIFSDQEANTSEEVLQNWEQIKKSEKGYKTQTEILKSVPEVLPALIRAYKVQKKAAHVGFDWDQIEDAMNKVEEEWEEFKEASKKTNNAHIEEEYGDFLFSMVNISRFLEINPEFALTKATEKFINRFEYIENTAKKQGKSLEEMTLQEMDVLWEQSKLRTK